jgi:ABC-2 type transport system permease protein
MSTMGKVLAIARVNLLRTIRDRSSTFFLFVLPLIIIVALGIQFGGTTRARVGVVAPAGDAFALAIVEALGRGDASVPFDVRRIDDEATLRSRVERGTLEVGLVIPADFEATLRGAGTATVRYLGTPESLTAGLRPAVEAAVARQALLVIAARAAAVGAPTDFATALAAARNGVEALPAFDVRVERLGEPGSFANYGQFTLGAQTQLVLFMFMTSLTAATQLVMSKQLGVSRRMVATPTAVPAIIAGEGLGRFAVVMLQAVVIVGVAAVVFGVDWGDPLAALALVLAFGLVGAGAAMLVGAIATNAEQAGSVAIFLALALAALGGCMIPIEFMPATMQTVAHLTPHAWAVDGLRKLITDGGGLASVAPQVGVLVAYGLALVALASWRFRLAITR